MVLRKKKAKTQGSHDCYKVGVRIAHAARIAHVATLADEESPQPGRRRDDDQ